MLRSRILPRLLIAATSAVLMLRCLLAWPVVLGTGGGIVDALVAALADPGSRIEAAPGTHLLQAGHAAMFAEQGAGLERATAGALIAARKAASDVCRVDAQAVARKLDGMAGFEASFVPDYSRLFSAAVLAIDADAAEVEHRVPPDWPPGYPPEGVDADPWWAKVTPRSDRLKAAEDRIAGELAKYVAWQTQSTWRLFLFSSATTLISFAILALIGLRYIRRTASMIAAGEQQLRCMALRYRAIVDSFQEVVFQADVSGKITFLNETWKRVLGYSIEGSLGCPLARYLHPADRARHAELFNALVREETDSYHQELRWLTKAGEVRWIEISARRDGAVEAAGGVCGVLTDITQRREERAREAAADHELVLRQYALDQAVMLAITDVKGRITYANEKFCAISGYSREELVGQDHRILNSGSHSKEFFRDMYRTIARGGVWRGELCNRAKDGSHFWVDTTIISRADQRGKPVAYLAIRVDITARKVAEAARSASERHALEKSAQLEATLANVNQGLCMFDAEQRLVVCNDRYAQIYRLSLDEVKPGMTLREIVIRRIAKGIYAGVDPDEYLRVRLAPITKPSYQIDELSDGRAIAITRQALPDGGSVITHTDVTDRRRADAQIAYMAHHDALTGLANRVLFHENVEQALIRLRQDGRRFAAFMLDLDRFKDVNDSLGHPVGDELLKAVAQRLRSCTRDTDTVARIGGDEFAILQAAHPDQDEEAIILASRLLERISAPYDLDGHKVIIGVSIGIALAPDHGTDAGELLRNADLALYKVKSNGRNGYRLFEVEMETEARSRRILEAELREAISCNEFELYYQPVIDSATRALAGAEALIRWRHPRRGLVHPDAFISLAEETGLIVQLGEWVLRQACADAANWAPQLSVAVNLSAAQFRKSNLVDIVAVAIGDSGLAAERLELEITESVLLEKNVENIGILHQLRSLGPRIVLDDFGTGFSSLSYVQAFPFDKIKIDKSFVDEIASRSSSAAIVCAIAGLARSLDIVTTAEGVETEEQLELLIAAGCNQVQGYLFGQPRAMSEYNFADAEQEQMVMNSA